MYVVTVVIDVVHDVAVVYVVDDVVMLIVCHDNTDVYVIGIEYSVAAHI